MKKTKADVAWLAVTLTIMLTGLTAVSWCKDHGYGLSVDFSPSMPKGLYVTLPIGDSIRRGETVLFNPPDAVAHYLVEQGWLIQGTHLLKHVFAVPGDEVCIKNHTVWINHSAVASVKSEYAPKKALPQIQLCRKLNADEYMLMSTYVANSFDSRYFGPVTRDAIIAQAKKI